MINVMDDFDIIPSYMVTRQGSETPTAGFGSWIPDFFNQTLRKKKARKR